VVGWGWGGGGGKLGPGRLEKNLRFLVGGRGFFARGGVGGGGVPPLWVPHLRCVVLTGIFSNFTIAPKVKGPK